MDTRYFQVAESVAGVRRIERGIELELGPHVREILRVELFREDVMRLMVSRNFRFNEQPSFAVCANLAAESPAFHVQESPGLVRLQSAMMSVTIYKQPFRIEAHRTDGSVILESQRDQDGRYWAYGTLNDEFVVRRKCGPEDAFFGLGEKTGRCNRKGRDFTLWNTDVLNPNVRGVVNSSHGKKKVSDPTSIDFDPYYISIPFFYHMPASTSGASGSFIENSYRGHFEFSQPEEYLIHFKGGHYTEYLFAGPAMRDILRSYTWLTGRMAPPPIWALGHHQCRWFAYTQEKFEDLAQTYRESGIPCDTLWLDIDYMDGYRVFTWDKERFPEHEAMLVRLKERGFRVITIIDPGVKCEQGYPVFDEATKKEFFCKNKSGATYLGQAWPGRTAFPDFTKPEARKWWGELNAAHVRSGLAGIWNDMNEPATGDISPDNMRFDDGKWSHESYHNQYALLMAMATVNGLREASPEKRTFVLSRAGSAGIQRYAANWMGDNASRWDHLWMSLPMALGLGLSGQPFVGADIGGFIDDCNPELLVRWYQLGTLTPFCRNHNAVNQADQYPWAFGDEVLERCRQALELRYQLMPYIYSQFMKSSETGAPIQAPLVFRYQDDPETRELDDEYLFGEHLLVAPIYGAGSTSREVYLPAGAWYQWHTGEKLSGGKVVDALAPLDYIPLYALGGAIIPTWPQATETTMHYHPKSIALHIFIPEEDCETNSILHEDDGLTYAFHNDAMYRTKFSLRREAARLSLTASVVGDGYPEFSRTEFQLHFHGGELKCCKVDGKEIRLQDASITLDNSGQSFELEVQIA